MTRDIKEIMGDIVHNASFGMKLPKGALEEVEFAASIQDTGDLYDLLWEYRQSLTYLHGLMVTSSEVEMETEGLGNWLGRGEDVEAMIASTDRTISLVDEAFEGL